MFRFLLQQDQEWRTIYCGCALGLWTFRDKLFLEWLPTRRAERLAGGPSPLLNGHFQPSLRHLQECMATGILFPVSCSMYLAF